MVLKTIKKVKRTKSASILFQCIPTDKTVKLMEEIVCKWPERACEARLYFLLDVADFMVNEIRKAKVSVSVDGEDKLYAEDLRIGILDDKNEESVVAIYLDGEKAEVTEEYATRTVLYFNSHMASPKWISVLNKYGPWPSNMVPIRVTSIHARIISRLARADELLALQEKMFINKERIELDFLKAGAPKVDIGETTNGIGLKVFEDLGYNVLRKEFGFDGQKKRAHWRPAIQKTKKYAVECMAKVVEYIQTGDKNVFNLSSESDNINLSVIKSGEGFAKEIAPFAK